MVHRGVTFLPPAVCPNRCKRVGRRHVIYWWFNQGGAVVQRDVRTIIKPFEITETKTKIGAGEDYYVQSRKFGKVLCAVPDR